MTELSASTFNNYCPLDKFKGNMLNMFNYKLHRDKLVKRLHAHLINRTSIFRYVRVK